MRPNPLRGWQALGQRLPATVAAGLTVGSLSAFAQISFGALLFSGSLAGAMGEGVSQNLLGGVVIGAVMALRGSFPARWGGPTSCRWWCWPCWQPSWPSVFQAPPPAPIWSPPAAR